MTKVCIYARYSSDLQSPTSIVDQVALCRAYAESQGWIVVQIREEPAVSGTNAANRPVYQQVTRDAEAHAFDVILVEDVSRLTRDVGELLSLHKRLSFAGVAIMG